MNSIYIAYLLIALSLVLLFFLLKFAIRLFFQSRIARLSSTNYPIILGLGLLLTGFLSLTTVWNKILETAITSAGNLLGTTIESPKQGDTYSLILYLIFCLAISYLLFLHYQSFRQKQLAEEARRNAMRFSPEKHIDPPPTVPQESKVFHQRIKETFELKFTNLSLMHDRPTSTLFGTFQYGFHTRTIFVCCDAGVENRTISKEDVLGWQLHIRSKINDLSIDQSREDAIDYYYIVEKGDFSAQAPGVLTFSEAVFSNNLVNFNEYLKDLIYKFKHNRLPFSNVDPDKIDNTLANTFIQPTFNNGRKNLKTFLDEWLAESSHRHIALLGDYGTGKTSLLKFYAQYLAQRILDGDRDQRIPIFVSLTGTSPMHRGIEAAIAEFLVNSRIESSLDLFNKLRFQGKLLFILDGFDEMGFIGTHEQRFAQLNAIWQLATTGNKIIISGRPSYFPSEFEEIQALNILDQEQQQIPQERPFCERIELDFFSEVQIRASVAKYYPEPELCQKYYEFIIQNQSILDLCKRPSMMHIVREMLPRVYENRENTVLNSFQLMTSYVEHWIERQFEKSIVSAVQNEQIRKSFIIDFFTDLAAKDYDASQGNLVISLKEIRTLLLLKIERELDLQGEEAIQGFENELLTGYFIERTENKFRFVHKSFFEFFVAKRIINLIEHKTLDNNLLFDKKWSDEVTAFVLDSGNLSKAEGNQNWERDFVPSMLLLTADEKTARKRFSFFNLLTKAHGFLNSHGLFVYFATSFFLSASLYTYITHNDLSLFIDILLSILLLFIAYFSGIIPAVFVIKSIDFLEKIDKYIDDGLDGNFENTLYSIYRFIISFLVITSFSIPFIYVYLELAERFSIPIDTITIIGLITSLLLILCYGIIYLVASKSTIFKFIARSFLAETARSNFPIVDYLPQFNFISTFYYTPRLNIQETELSKPLQRNNLINTNYYKVSFTKKSLSYCNFVQCNLHKCNFYVSGSSLLSFRNCSLINCKFINGEIADILTGFKLHIDDSVNIDTETINQISRLIVDNKIDVDNDNITASNEILNLIKERISSHLS